MAWGLGAKKVNNRREMNDKVTFDPPHIFFFSLRQQLNKIQMEQVSLELGE